MAPRQGVRNRTRRPQGSTDEPVRSVRVGDELWAKARARATYEGITMSLFLYRMVEGYAQGWIDMPQTKVVYAKAPATVTIEPGAE